VSLVPGGLRYTKDHKWVRLEGDIARVGITDHAQHEMTEIVFVEVPKVGQKVRRGEVLGVVESVKTVAEVYSPVSGEVVETNLALEESPQFINESPYENGWIAAVKLSDGSEAGELMSPEDYKRLLGE